MKKMKLVTFALILLVVGTAQAGIKLVNGANVDVDGRTAWGDAMSARASADTHAGIGCSILGYSTGPGGVLCEAVDSTGVYAVCFSDSATIIAAAASAGPNSYYYFQWDASSQCTYLYVSNASLYGPMTP
jgi:hypothetical protein